jgi:putative metallohydrolase (TIGR04338 family)
MTDAKIYDAEWKLSKILETPDVPFTIHGCTVTIPVERKFGHIDTVRAYVKHVCNKEGRSAPYVVVNNRLKKKATYCLGTITMPNFSATWAWRESVVLHEIAHHLSPGTGHGPHFQKTLVRLLDTYIGAEVGWVYSILATEAINV